MGAKTSTRAPGAERLPTQSKMMPLIALVEGWAPVEKTTSICSRRMLPRRSPRPGRIVTRYVVLGRNPVRGSTSMASRRQLTRSRPSPGETVTRDASDEALLLLLNVLAPPPAPSPPTAPPPAPLPAPPLPRASGADRSFTTSSNRKSTARARTLRLFVSGVTSTSCGGSLSGGPPGGMPGEAQALRPSVTPQANTRTVRSIRRTPTLTRRAPGSSRAAGPRECPTHVPSRARRRLPPAEPWR